MSGWPLLDSAEASGQLRVHSQATASASMKRFSPSTERAHQSQASIGHRVRLSWQRREA